MRAWLFERRGACGPLTGVACGMENCCGAGCADTGTTTGLEVGGGEIIWLSGGGGGGGGGGGSEDGGRLSGTKGIRMSRKADWTSGAGGWEMSAAYRWKTAGKSEMNLSMNSHRRSYGVSKSRLSTSQSPMHATSGASGSMDEAGGGRGGGGGVSSGGSGN